MRLTAHSDYALRILVYLQGSPAPLVPVGEIAHAFGISKHHLVKVAGGLSRLGLIETVRGRTGGIRLASPPQGIRIGEVVRQMEPDFHIVECFHPATNTCGIARGCALKGPLYAARDAFLTTLDQFTLADLGSRPAMQRELTRLMK